MTSTLRSWGMALSVWAVLPLCCLRANAQLVQKAELYNNICVKPGGTMPVDAKGWRKGDRVTFTPVDNRGKEFTAKLRLETDSTAQIRLPRQLSETAYKVSLQRGKIRQDLGKTYLKVPEKMPKGSPVVAHRAVWRAPGSAQNSRASVKRAIELGIHACEIDIWQTTDGRLVVNHDATLNGVMLQNSTYDEVKDLRLPNGETIPLLSELLDMVKAGDVAMNFFIEIKRHRTEEKNRSVVEAVVKMIQDYHLQSKTSFISFGFSICEHLSQLLPECPAFYIEHLTRDLSQPNQPMVEGAGIVDFEKVKKARIPGMSINPNMLFVRHPEWMQKAHSQGLKVNCCVVDGAKGLIRAMNEGAEFVTTNTPETAQRLFLHYRRNQ
ncbi:MAG: hypothetical protein ILA34_06415 [Bacteroidaceae bacterium]|nr:hypothetical protein [Bacteroidaceae bacterium]